MASSSDLPALETRSQPLIKDAGFASNARDIDSEAEVTLTSIGVDIGSTTSHFVVSRMRLSLAEGRYITVGAETVFQSEIEFTPYATAGTIDVRMLDEWMRRQYRTAGLHRNEVDTGVVLLTGTALQKRNSRAIAELFADETGRFVAVAAGHDLEAELAARGSGAVSLSRRENISLLHVDVGGGTTKYALCVAGEVKATAALNVGARAIVVDENGRVVRIEHAGRTVTRLLGLNLPVGVILGETDRLAIARFIANRVVDLIELGGLSPMHRGMMLTPPLPTAYRVDAVTFSGGVSEYVHGREEGDFGDLGAEIGLSIREQVRTLAESRDFRILELPTGIRATVLGASRYTVQLSGQTVFVSSRHLLPLRNVPLVRAPADLMARDMSHRSVYEGISNALRGVGHQTMGEGPIAVCIEWRGPAVYDRIDALCRGLLDAMIRHVSRDNPIVIVVIGDVAGLLGLHLSEELGVSRVVSLDGLSVGECDFLDIGSVVVGTGAVPVVVKSLVFPTDPSLSFR